MPHSSDLSPYGVRAGSGTLRPDRGVALEHSWTEHGVVAAPVTNGAQVLHLSVALCVLNDLHREAQRLGVTLDGVAVAADGGFDDEWRSTGVAYTVTLDTTAAADAQRELLAAVDEVAEIPRALRAGVAVRRQV